MIAVAVYSLLRMVMDDFQKRSVSLDLMILFGVSQFWNAPLENVYYNGLILIIIGCAVFLYYRLIRIKINFLDSIGGGDLLFLLCVTPYFWVPEFVLYFIVSSLCVLAYKVDKAPPIYPEALVNSPLHQDKTVPQLTLQGIPYLIWLLYEKFLPDPTFSLSYHLF